MTFQAMEEENWEPEEELDQEAYDADYAAVLRGDPVGECIICHSTVYEADVMDEQDPVMQLGAKGSFVHSGCFPGGWVER